MKVHKSCKTLSIYSFDRIVDTTDLRYLIRDFDEFEEENFKLTIVEAQELSTIFENILNEYNGLTANTKMFTNYKKRMAILELEFLHDTTVKILKLFVQTNTIEVLGLLVDLKWSFDADKPIEEQVAAIEQSLKGIRNRIRISKASFVNAYKDSEEPVKNNLGKEALYLEINLGISRKIDTKTTSVEEWVNMINLSVEKNKKNVSNKHNDS